MPDWSTSLPAVLTLLLSLTHIVVCVLALGVFPGSRKPSTAMAWLILVLAVPYFGFLIFLLFGRTSVGRKRREWQLDVNRQVVAALEAEAPDRPAVNVADDVRGLAHLNQNLGALPLTSDNTVEITTDYPGCFEAMRREVEAAEKFVHVQFYISAWDEMTGPFFEAMAAAAERGVDVRFLFDHLGSRGIPGYKDMISKLEATKIVWAPMLPVQPLKGEFRRPDLRNHRKILVVDGRVGFAGSQNLTEPGYNKPKNHKLGREWVELMTRVEGPIVRQLNLVFVTDWYSETNENLRSTLEPGPPAPAPTGAAVGGVGAQVVPSGPGFATENNLRLFNSMLYAAERRLSLTSPYFVPDESLLYAVTTAAQRGVEVELFVSATADQFMVHHAQRSYYDALLTAGVRIWLYPEPYVLHAKHFTVDDSLAVIGSSNMDMRSFALNYEVVLMLTGAEVVQKLSAVQDIYRSLSTELTMDEWRKRTWGAKYVDNVMRLTAALQ